MGMVRAKCLNCGEQFDAKNNEDVGLCPNCGAAYITENVIKNYYASLTRTGSSASPQTTHQVQKATTTAYHPHLKWVASVLCCIPIIIELLAVFVIPYIDFLNGITYLSSWTWQSLSLQFKISVGLIIGLGILVQLLGLFRKAGNLNGMFAQLVSFLLFVFAVFAAQNNENSVYAQYALAALAPLSLLIGLGCLTKSYSRHSGASGFLRYLPIALEVATYTLFLFVFPIMFGHEPSLWMFVAMSVITVAAIAVSTFWRAMRWAAIGAALAFAVLLSVLAWLGTLITAEWLESGGIILLVVLVIGGSIFIHWFIHRNDDDKIWK